MFRRQKPGVWHIFGIVYAVVLLITFTNCGEAAPPGTIPNIVITKTIKTIREHPRATPRPKQTSIKITLQHQPCTLCHTTGVHRFPSRAVVTTHQTTSSNYPNIVTAKPLRINLIDTSSNIHLFLAFSYKIDNPGSVARYYDFVWGAQTYQVDNLRSANQNILLSYYMPFHRDPGTYNDNQAFQSLNYWRTSHPDWILYRCDRKTPAYEDGQSVPFDFTNPTVINWQIQNYALPASQHRYNALAVDNVNLENIGGGCGFYHNGQWIQRYSGQSNDAQYRSDVLSWLSQMQTALHTLPHPMALIPNLSLLPLTPTDPFVQQIISHVDGIMDEGGFTNYGTGYITDATWQQTVQYIENVQQQGKPFYDLNEFNSGTPDNNQKQWALASYLMSNDHHSAFFMAASQNYGADTRYPEYSAQIGSPTSAMYTAQNVYWRNFTNGIVIVNPSSSNSYTITTNGNHTDIGGHSVGQSLTMPPHSGIILLNA